MSATIQCSDSTKNQSLSITSDGNSSTKSSIYTYQGHTWYVQLIHGTGYSNGSFTGYDNGSGYVAIYYDNVVDQVSHLRMAGSDGTGSSGKFYDESNNTSILMTKGFD